VQQVALRQVALATLSSMNHNRKNNIYN